MILAGLLTQPAMDRLSAQAMGEGLLKQSVLVETIGGLETVKSSGAAPIVTAAGTSAMEDHSTTSLRQRLVANIGITVAGTAQMLAYAGVVVVGVELIASQDLTMGGLIACSILAGRAVAPLGQIAQLLSRMTATRTAYRQLNGLMKAARKGPEGEPLVITRTEGRIEFRNVHFRYPGASEKALEGVNFTIEPGEHVALLGRVGSGKSTIARLLLGLYEPEEGRDHARRHRHPPARPDRPSAPRSAARCRRACCCPARCARISCSAGRGSTTRRWSAPPSFPARTSSWARSPTAMTCRLADRGEGLSGGQRQSIAIARALAGRAAGRAVRRAVERDGPADRRRAAPSARGGARRAAPSSSSPTARRSFGWSQRMIIVDRGKVVADGPRDQVLQKIIRPKVAAI